MTEILRAGNNTDLQCTKLCGIVSNSAQGAMNARLQGRVFFCSKNPSLIVWSEGLEKSINEFIYWVRVTLVAVTVVFSKLNDSGKVSWISKVWTPAVKSVASTQTTKSLGL